jgi:fumarylacetoacetase
MNLDETHDPALRSWVESANDPATEFPIQNLPFGRFRKAGASGALRIGVAIGDQVLDLGASGLIDTDDMHRLMAASVADRRRLRRAISAFLREGEVDQKARDCLVAQSDVEMGLPCRIGDYTDFYTSIHHATTVGKQFRPENPLLPNYKWVPIGYHGRASSIGVTGESFARPNGQIKPAEAEVPSVGPTRRLDYELEIGVFIGTPNERGDSVAMVDAEAHVFGLALFNDWTARDIQSWEYQPLGPFLSRTLRARCRRGS